MTCGKEEDIKFIFGYAEGSLRTIIKREIDVIKKSIETIEHHARTTDQWLAQIKKHFRVEK